MYTLNKKERELREQARGCYPEGLQWYTAMVHCGHEVRVANWIDENLKEQGVDEVLLPILRPNGQSRRLQTKGPFKFLFHSYLFIRCTMNDEVYVPLAEHSSVFRIMGRSYRIPSLLNGEEIQYLKGILESDCRPSMADRRNIGEHAEVIEGLMAGMEGRIIAINSKEAKLEVAFSFLDMGTGVVLVVPRDNLRVEGGSQENA